MNEITNVSRRGFLQGVFSAGALVLSVKLVPQVLLAAEIGATGTVDQAPFHPSMWVGIEPDGTVIIVAHRSEMGSGSRTALPLVLADEMDADWKRVKIEQAIGEKLDLRGLSAALRPLKRHEKPGHPAQFLIAVGTFPAEIVAVFAAVAVPAGAFGKWASRNSARDLICSWSSGPP